MRARLHAGLAGAVACQYALAAAHHVYGGLVYDTPIRLFMPVYGALAYVATGACTTCATPASCWQSG